MVYHGQPRILTEIAGGNLADTVRQPAEGHARSGRRSRAGTSRCRTPKDTWTLQQQVDYGVTAALAGMAHVAKYGREWLYNFYQVHRDWVNYDKRPFAFVVPAAQRDPFATYEMLDILQVRATSRSIAPRRRSPPADTQYPAGSWVIKTAQPYGAFAKTMLEKQIYPDLRLFPGGPPEPPYDVTGHTLWMLMGVAVDAIEQAVRRAARAAEGHRAGRSAGAGPGQGRVSDRPGILRRLQVVAELQKANVPTFRAARAFEAGGQKFAPGTFVIPPTPAAQTDRGAGREAGVPGLRRRSRAGGGRLPPEAGHARRLVSRREQHAGRLDDVVARAVRHQPPGGRGAGLPGSRRQVRRHPAALRHLAAAHRVNGLDQAAQRSRRSGGGRPASARMAGSKLRAFVENGGTLLAIGVGRRHRTRAARPADREGAAGSAAALCAGRGARGRGSAAGQPMRSIARCATRSAARRS